MDGFCPATDYYSIQDASPKPLNVTFTLLFTVASLGALRGAKEGGCSPLGVDGRAPSQRERSDAALGRQASPLSTLSP